MRDLLFGILIFSSLVIAILSNAAVIGLVAGGLLALVAYISGSEALSGRSMERVTKE